MKHMSDPRMQAASNVIFNTVGIDKRPMVFSHVDADGIPEVIKLGPTETKSSNQK